VEADRLRAIIKAQSDIAAADLDSRGVMLLVAERARRITRATAGIIAIPDDDEMVYAVTTGEATPYQGMRAKRDSSFSGLALTQGKVLSCEDSETDSRVDREACRRINARSLICVPLRHRLSVVGVLKVYSPEPERFGRRDIETLQMLSDLVSAQIAHADLYELEARENRTDALTGLLNRRAYEERLAVESARAARTQRPLALCIFDLDDFKSVNDRQGHPAGDEVLRGVASVIAGSRLSDDGFRIGGDEFAILMPDTSAEGAEIAGRRLAAAIAKAQLGDGRVTASFGVAARIGDPLGLHEQADRNLLAGKRSGERSLAGQPA
jgi:diguanylate cyclase